MTLAQEQPKQPPNSPTKQRTHLPPNVLLISRNLLDFMAVLNPTSPPPSPPADEEFDPPSPSKSNFDAHFGYTPSPPPPREVANLLTQEQIDMGMYKVEAGSGTAAPMVPGSMGPPQPVLREEIVDMFRGRGASWGWRSWHKNKWSSAFHVLRCYCCCSEKTEG